jgi:hypothetical protein
VSETRHGTRFANEALAQPRIVLEILFQELDGDEAIEARIPRQVERSHAAGTEATLDFITSDAGGSHDLVEVLVYVLGSLTSLRTADKLPAMSGLDSVKSLLVLRKLTRAIADAARAQLTEYLTTVTPLLQPQGVLGDYIQGAQKETSLKADQSFKDLKALYEAVAPAKPLNLRRELSPPFSFSNLSLEITPLDYIHVVQTDTGSRKITVRSPLTWTLTYAGFAPNRLQEVLDQKVRGDELQRFILSYLLINVVTKYRPGVMQMLEGLHFPVTTTTSVDFGDLPLTRIGIGISTMRPSDDMVVESAELTGMDAFEEVVSVAEIARLPDPFKERLLDLARKHAPELV